MPLASYKNKKSQDIKTAVVVYPFTYANPYQTMPPIAAEYLQAYLLDAGVETELFDLRFESDLEVLREPVAKADLVCFYGHFEDCSLFGTWKYHSIPEVMRMIPESTPVIAGGTGFEDPQQSLKDHPRLDVVIRGNPEYPVKQILKTGAPEEAPNTIYRQGEEFIETPLSHAHNALSETVYPRRDRRKDHYRYQAFGIELDLVRAAVGCNYRCKFCYQFGKDFEGNFIKWQGRSAQSLYNEMSEIRAPMVGWVDDDMTTNMQTLSELADLLLKNKVRKIWGGTGRVDHVIKSDVPTLKKLEKAGLFALSFGVEALKPETLRFYGKGQTIEKIEQAMEMMNQTNVLLLCNFIIGSPGENRKDIMDMLWFGRKWNVDSMVTNRLRIPENTTMWDAVYEKDGTIRPGKEMMPDHEVAEMKYKLKFGQRTPFRIMMTVFKMYRHRGFFLEPVSFLFSIFETLIRHTWLEKTRVLPWFFAFNKWLLNLPPVRWLSRAMAYILSPLLYATNWVFERMDKALGISTFILPKILLAFRDKVYRKQQVVSQVSGVDYETPEAKAEKARCEAEEAGMVSREDYHSPPSREESKKTGAGAGVA